MKITLNEDKSFDWQVKKIAVIGPGIVGMPMAALLAHARIRIGTEQPARVLVVQRNSVNSGWKVDAINAGKSIIGGIEPGLDSIVKESVDEGILSATHDYRQLSDADVILVCVQTDKKGLEPDYGPMFGALTTLAEALQNKPSENVPLIVFESTLAPSTMTTLMRAHFEQYGLIEGKDILLGNSPNRVMPGRLVERVTESDKLVAGLHPESPRMIKEIYQHIVTEGELHPTNSMTAEVTKTLENAYRDVRIAFSTEIVRYCDEHNVDYYALRDQINEKLAQEDKASGDPNAVPSGGMLIPMLGVGGHCLPKDGILLWWRRIESGYDTSNSLIVRSRAINDESPAETIKIAERSLGPLVGRNIAILGTAYRFNSEDTRNSPSIQLALQLRERGCTVTMHDPYVKTDDQNLLKFQVDDLFTRDLAKAVGEAEIIFFGTAHKEYLEGLSSIVKASPKLKGIVDACNLYKRENVENLGLAYTGIGRGKKQPETAFVNFVFESFQSMERGLANEVNALVGFLNDHFVSEDFNRVRFEEVQRLAASCNTGCVIVDPGFVEEAPTYKGFSTRLNKCAKNQLATTT